MNKHPKWLEQGIISAGMYEGLMFPRRRGSSGSMACSRPDDEQAFRASFSDEFAERLAVAGVNLLILNFFKGFGLEAEHEEQELTRQMTEICHRRGIKVGVYIGETLFKETFFKERPEAVNWVCRKADGSPVFYNSSQTFRLRACRNNPDWQKYILSVVEKAVVDFKVDWVHFDNFFWSAPPGDCHCNCCCSLFRNYLKQKYSPAELKQRLGFSSLEFILPPDNRDSPYQYNAADPLVQEWLRFRCHSLTKTFQTFSQAIRRLNPECVVELNCRGLAGVASAGLYGVEHAEILKHADVFWDEHTPFPGLAENGTLVTRARSYKLAEAREQKPLLYTVYHDLHRPAKPPNSDDALLLGEAMTFGRATLGAVNFVYYSDRWEMSAEAQTYIRFFHENQKLFQRRQTLAVAAVYRGADSLLLDYLNSDYKASLAEQILLQAHIPYDLLLDGDLPAKPDPRVIILCGQTCLADALYDQLIDYARHGGKLLAIGACGTYDSWRRVRAQSLDQAIRAMGLSNARAIDDIAGNREMEALRENPWSWSLAKLRLLPDWEKMPENIKSLHHGQFPVLIAAPDYVLVEPVRVVEGVAIHILNFNRSLSEEIVITVRSDILLAPRELYLYIPDKNPKRLTPLTGGRQNWQVQVECPERHGCIYSPSPA